MATIHGSTIMQLLFDLLSKQPVSLRGVEISRFTCANDTSFHVTTHTCIGSIQRGRHSQVAVANWFQTPLVSFICAIVTPHKLAVQARSDGCKGALDYMSAGSHRYVNIIQVITCTKRKAQSSQYRHFLSLPCSIRNCISSK